MNHRNRGQALIFHQSHDQIAQDPKLTLAINLFKSLKFHVKIFTDQKLAEIKNILKSTAEEDHSDNDCLVVLVMTSNDGKKLKAKDNLYFPDALWEPFSGEKCLTLLGKPKIFLIQSGQVKRSKDRTMKKWHRFLIDSPDLDSESDFMALPTMADFLIMFSNCEDLRKSHFLEYLSKSLEKQEEPEHLLHSLTKVSRQIVNSVVIHGKKSKPGKMPVMVSMLTKILQNLHPEVDENHIYT